MGEQKRSLREFLRHVNDYTYRFDPEKGRFRYRELRGVRDTAFDFYMWLKCWKDMIVFVAKCPVSAVVFHLPDLPELCRPRYARYARQPAAHGARPI